MQNSSKEPNKIPDINKQRRAGLLLIETGVEFAVIIGLPLYGFILLGKWLDTKYQKHFFVIIGIFIALFLSSIIIYRKINQIKNLLK